MRRSSTHLPICLLLLLSLVACANDPSPVPASGNANAGTANTRAGTAAIYASDLAAHAGVRVDCRSDSECAVKDVGNCCGRYDACVRADSPPVDGKALADECAKRELAGICGYPVIESCVCTAGRCEAAPSQGRGPDEAVQ